jgi:hypothetical protein
MSKHITALVLIALAALSCGKSKAQNVSVEVLTAPDGSRCYAIKQGDEVRGGNCR